MTRSIVQDWVYVQLKRKGFHLELEAHFIGGISYVRRLPWRRLPVWKSYARGLVRSFDEYL